MNNKSKHLASISLAIMGAGFLTSLLLNENPIVAIIHGGFEAGLVGGLADWFAVTALFRHPLGIPIPHTALLPKKRKSIISGIVTTVQDQWLSVESIKTKITKIRFAEIIIPILERELHSDTVKRSVVSICKTVVKQIRIETITPQLDKKIRDYIASLPLEKLAQTAGEQAIKNKVDEKLLDTALDKVEGWLIEPGRKEQLGHFALNALDNVQGDGLLQFALKSLQSMVNEEKLGKMLQNILLTTIANTREERNDYKQNILFSMKGFLSNLGDNKALTTELKNMVDSLLSNWNSNEQLTEILTDLQEQILEFLDDERFIDDYYLPLVTKAVNDFKSDSEKIGKFETWVQTQVATLIENNHEEIGKLVRENLEKLDDETLIDMVENNIGKDLQWIRVNGAVCGFIIGIILSSINVLIGG